MLESHPGIPLEKHLREAGKRVSQFCSEIPLSSDFGKIAYKTALSHDLGKATSFFQDHLHGKRKKTTLTSHALLSAIIAILHTAKEIPLRWKLPVFLSIKNHHSHPTVLENELSIKYEWEDLKTQADSIKKEELFNVLSTADLSFSEQLLPADVRSLQLSFFWPAQDYAKSCSNLHLYFTTNLLLGMLVDADIRAVVNMQASEERVILPENLVDEYLENLPNHSPINSLRKEFYNTVMENVKKACRETKLMSLMAPTGLGKTLTGLSAAIKLRTFMQEKAGYLPRIIYVLPYTSIIDQNFRVISDVLQSSGLKNEDLLLKHHHRASPESIVKDGVKVEDIWKSLEEGRLPEKEQLQPYEKAHTRIETWDGEIIVTTFVQFLETIFTNHRGNMRRLHRLAGSIVVLDEVQNIPVKYWEATEKALKYMAENWDNRIILMTATMPSLLTDAFELTGERKQFFFSKMSRTRLHIDSDQKQYTDIQDWLLPQIENARNFMVIMNTVKSAQEVYENLKKNCRFKNHNLKFLSASLIPFHREIRIEEVKERLKKGEKVGLVATQVVEAGVDLDFEVVVRDFAPLDSIVQAAGRCNRNMKGKSGKVILVNLADQRRTLANYIYDPVIIAQTGKILSGKKSLEEKDYLRFVETFFKKLRNPEEIGESVKIQDTILLDSMKNLNYDNISGFNLITDFFHIPVFIEYDEEAEEIVENLILLEDTRAFKYDDRMKKRNIFLSIKSRIWKYVINVPLNTLTELSLSQLPFLSSILYVPATDLDQFYNEDTGFVRTEIKNAAIFI